MGILVDAGGWMGIAALAFAVGLFRVGGESVEIVTPTAVAPLELGGISTVMG